MVPPQKHGQYLLSNIHSFDQFLERGWNFRVVDQHKNFAYIANEKLNFHFSEHESLVEYSADGQPTRSYQGFVLMLNLCVDWETVKIFILSPEHAARLINVSKKPG